jgi:glyoxylase-like metal-dependent hydrolase (beta-lactamase superfamily II)
MPAATPAAPVLFPDALRAKEAGLITMGGGPRPEEKTQHVTADTRAITQEWAEPGVYPVAPGVHRVPLPLPTDRLRAVNVYVLEAAGGLVLIDSGWALEQAHDALTAALATLGAELGDVRSFLVTHVHRDHYTLAVQLRRTFGTRVSLGLGEQEAIAALLAGGIRPFAPQLAELRASGAGAVLELLAGLNRAVPVSAGDWETPDEWLTSDQEIGLGSRVLRVLATPGHTQGHVVFTDAATGLLFAGDHVLPHITPSIGFEPVAARYPLRDYLQSLRLVRGLPDMRLLPAHGPVTQSAHARIDQLLAHHDRRLDQCAAAVAHGAATAYEVARALRWTRRERQLDELDPVNQMLAVIETRAHLELLAAQGRLASSQADGVTVYRPPSPQS